MVAGVIDAPEAASLQPLSWNLPAISGGGNQSKTCYDAGAWMGMMNVT